MLRLTFKHPDLTKGYERSIPDGPDVDTDVELTALAKLAHELDEQGNKALAGDAVRMSEDARAYGSVVVVDEEV